MKPRVGGLITAGLLLLLLSPAWGKPLAVVPIAPMAWLLQQVAQDQVDILTLIPSGASPHSYEITPRQMAELSTADIWFSLNLPLERRLLARLREAADMRIIDLNQGISPRYFSAAERELEEEEDEGHADAALAEPDPHTWLDPRNASLQAANMAHALAEQGIDTANLTALQARLQALDLRLAEALAPYRGQSFLVYHPAFGYLAQRYQLQQAAVEMEGKEPAPRRLARWVEQAKARDIKIIFVQPQFPKDAVQQLAQEIEGSVMVLDPLAYDYINNLEIMVKNLKMGL